MNKGILIFVSVFSLVIYGCSEPDHVNQDNSVATESMEDLTEEELADKKAYMDAAEEIMEKNYDEKVQEKIERDNNPNATRRDLDPDNYTADKLKKWALANAAQHMEKDDIAIKIKSEEHYDIYMQTKKANAFEEMQLLSKNKSGEPIDEITIFDKEDEKDTEFQWTASDRIDVIHHRVNAQNNKAFKINKRYRIQEDGKFFEIVR